MTEAEALKIELGDMIEANGEVLKVISPPRKISLHNRGEIVRLSAESLVKTIILEHSDIQRILKKSTEG